MSDTTHLCSISYQDTPDCPYSEDINTSRSLDFQLYTYMFRYKEAFLDINQFIRDLFVILSSLNASHNNVEVPQPSLPFNRMRLVAA